MKRLTLSLILIIAASISCVVAQTSRPLLAVGEIDANDALPGNGYSTLSEMAMRKMERIGVYEMLDQYDMNYLAKRDDIVLTGCYSKICLTEIGAKLHVDKMLTGSIRTVGDNITVNFRILDVKSGIVERTRTNDFLKINAEYRNMIEITLDELMGNPVDEETKKKLTLKNDFDNTVNNPYQLRLRSDGPRMGFTLFTGETATILGANRNVGGFEAQPMMFQFGYQFEKQYLNEGNFQALFEFIPMMTGLDQGLFIPSITVMNGLRNNKNGWEFAFGPTFSVVTKSQGYYAADTHRWTLLNDSLQTPENADVITRLDSRGDASVQAGFIFAFGKTFKSGKLNIPVNAFVIPSNKGLRFGVSFGFNARDRYAYTAVK